MEELHRIYEQQISHWFYNLLSPAKQQKLIEDSATQEDLLIFKDEDQEADDIIWN